MFPNSLGKPSSISITGFAGKRSPAWRTVASRETISLRKSLKNNKKAIGKPSKVY